MPDIATDNMFEHFYEVALTAVHEYSKEPKIDYLEASLEKGNWIDLVEFASCWAMEACQCRHPDTLDADVSTFKAQMLHDDIFETVMFRSRARIFGRYNENYQTGSTLKHEQILRKLRRQNAFMVERGGLAHSFLFMNDTSHMYILQAIDKECEVARRSCHAIDFDVIAEQLLFEVGRDAQEHFIDLALVAAERYLAVAPFDEVDERTSELKRRRLQNFARTIGLAHVDDCRPRALSADVSYFEHLILDHDLLGIFAYD